MMSVEWIPEAPQHLPIITAVQQQHGSQQRTTRLTQIMHLIPGFPVEITIAKGGPKQLDEP